MTQLTLVKNSQFGTLKCNYYGNAKGQFFMTRQQIGEALEYTNPQEAIKDIHSRHKTRLDKFSVQRKLRGTDGKMYDTFLYSAKGIYEICRHSHQPKADDFYDHVYEILEGLRLGYIELTLQRQTVVWKDTRAYAKEIRKQEAEAIKELVEYAISNGSTHAKTYYTSLSTLADKAAGIQKGKRDQSSIAQLNILSLVERIIADCIHEGVSQGISYKDIYKACKERAEDFQAVIASTGSRAAN